MKRITDLFPSAFSLRRLSGAGPAVRGPARRGTPRPRALLGLEALEDRTVPSLLTVTTPTDVVLNGDDLLSLREAILIANDSTDVADTIVFDNSLTDETVLLNGTRLPTITSELTITGLGAEHLTIDAQNNSGIFWIDFGVTGQISGLTLTRGNATNAQGGGILNFGTLEVADSTLSDNSAYEGGAIFSLGSLTLAGSNLSGNSAIVTGGAIFSELGGELTVTDSTLSDNLADVGGAIINGGTATVTGSTLSGNSAASHGGAIYNFGTLTVAGSTLSGNSTGSDFTEYSGGGAIYNSGTLTVADSTLSDNSTDAQGGAIYNIGTATVTGSTIVLNRADADDNGTDIGGGIYNFTSATTLSNTIVAGNLRGTGTTADDIGGFIDVADSSHNLIGDPSTAGGLVDGVNGNIVGNDGVGVIDIATVIDTTLADNGGPTKTHALVIGGPAIDAGDNSLIPPGTDYDQRGEGFARIVGGTVDIGAFEVQNQAPVVSDFTLVGAEDNVLTFTAADFTAHYSDPDGDALVSVRIESLPANGTLKLNGVAVSAGQVIAAADLGGLVFVPDLNFYGQPTFTYTASDGFSGFALAPATVTLHIQSAAEQAAEIAARIDALYAAGVINEGQAEALTFYLKDNNGDAGKVGAFLNEVNAYVLAGILTEEEAGVLLKFGNMLLVSLTTG
jgi:hypothetical protein